LYVSDAQLSGDFQALREPYEDSSSALRPSGCLLDNQKLNHREKVAQSRDTTTERDTRRLPKLFIDQIVGWNESAISQCPS
jgi:hypothetical protein